MHAIRMSAYGGPEVLEWAQIEDPQPGRGQVVISVEAAGVNFIDVYRRTGLYPGTLPAVPGAEAAGTVVAVGPEVQDVSIGDRVACCDLSGAYAERAVATADRTVPVPDTVSSEAAAAVLLQGLTAHYLTRDTFPLSSGDRCLIHAAAGGVGLLLVQMAKALGAEVFATVGSAAKAELATHAGADHVIVYTEQAFAEAIEKIAGPKPIDVVYDGVGRATFAPGLDVLRRRGMMVTFGNASGPVDPISPLQLSAKGSLFLTRPILGDYTATTPELRTRAQDVFDAVAAARLQVRVGDRLPLSRAAEAHTLLESRRSSGKILLLP